MYRFNRSYRKEREEVDRWVGTAVFNSMRSIRTCLFLGRGDPTRNARRLRRVQTNAQARVNNRRLLGL